MLVVDSINVSDDLEVEWRQDPLDHHLACPRCWHEEREDRAMKEDHGGGLVCSLRRCRHRLSSSEREKTIPSHVSYSSICCPKCGRGVKKHHDQSLICSNRACRFQFRLEDYL